MAGTPWFEAVQVGWFSAGICVPHSHQHGSFGPKCFPIPEIVIQTRFQWLRDRLLELRILIVKSCLLELLRAPTQVDLHPYHQVLHTLETGGLKLTAVSSGTILSQSRDMEWQRPLWFLSRCQSMEIQSNSIASCLPSRLVGCLTNPLSITFL